MDLTRLKCIPVSLQTRIVDSFHMVCFCLVTLCNGCLQIIFIFPGELCYLP